MLGHDASATGRAFLPAPVLITAGTALLVRAPADGSYAVDVPAPVLLVSAAFAAAMPALTGLAMSGARAEDARLASGLFDTTQVVGGSPGLAALTTLEASRTGALLDRGTELVPATAEGYRVAFRVATGIALAAPAPAAVMVRPRRDLTPR